MPASSTRTKSKTSRRKPAARPAAKTRKGRRQPTAHVVLDERPVETNRRLLRTRASTRTSPTPPPRVRKHGKDHAALPTWKDLEKATNGRIVPPKSHAFDSISTARMALLILVVGAAVTAYVGHVQATQHLLGDLQTLKSEHASLRLELNSVKGEYDRLTGPAAIRTRARALGLVENTAFGEPVLVETPW